jgi:hypothetical protein
LTFIEDLVMSEEKRQFTRVPFKVEAELKIGEIIYRSDDISNLSVGGCLLPIHTNCEAGAKCHVKIRLGGTNSGLTVAVEGKVLRASPDAVAIKFTGVDVDGLFHLQNIVRYNSSDPDAVEREIRDHFGIV